MPNLSLGTIEVLGLPAAVEAADVALKTADVELIGYETTDGMGMVAVKVEGQVSAVQAAVAAASAAASRISKVFATSVIPRPSDQLTPVVLTSDTVGLAAPVPPAAVEPVAVVEPPTVAEPATVAEPVEAPDSTLRQAQGSLGEAQGSSGAAQGSLDGAPTAPPRAPRTRKSAGRPAASK